MSGASGRHRACRSITSRIVAAAGGASGTILPPVLPEELLVRRLAHVLGREGHHDARDVEEVAEAEVVGDAVAAPGATAHRQGERERVVEAAPGREAVGL